MRRIVVVGAGLAGHRAALALRREGFDGELCLVGSETHRPYDRPPLSKQALRGEMEHERCFYPCDGLEDAGWRLGVPAAALDVSAGVVTLADDSHLGYDGLILATGRRARALPGAPRLEGVCTLRTLDDGLALRAAVESSRRVAIVGAGFIGCEEAATLRTRGVEEVALIDLASHPMPPLGAEVGRRAAALHEVHGVALHLGTGVEGLEGRGRVEAVRLADGARVPADLVLVAIGSEPNSEWLADSGLKLRGGTVRCDEHCLALGADNVAAAGDIASWPHPAAGGEPVCVEHWTNAREMGELAAHNLLAAPGERRAYAGVPTFWSDQYDVKLKSAGFLDRADSVEVVEEDPKRPSLVAEARRDGALVGAIVFNKNRTIIDYQRRLAAEAGT